MPLAPGDVPRVEREPVRSPPPVPAVQDPFLERVNGLRKQWWSQWPLSGDSRGIAMFASALDVLPEHVIEVGRGLPKEPVGLVVERATASGSVLLFGCVEVEENGPDRKPNETVYVFGDPVVRLAMTVPERPGPPLTAASHLLAELTDWYRRTLLGQHITRLGRPRKSDTDSVINAIRELHGDYRERYLEGTVERGLMLQDVADKLGISADTVERRLGDIGLTFTNLVEKLDREYDRT